ncbi:unnamed protein product [Caenorhabditis brenneri]
MGPLDAEYNDSANNSNDIVTDAKWSKIFPPCTAEFEMSSKFITRALFVAFSVILKRRKILPPDYFSKNHITEKISCASLNFNNEKALKIAQLLKNTGDAVQLGYLKEIALVITKNEQDEEAIEVYSFKFHYFDHGVTAQFNTTANGEQLSPFDRLAKLEYQGTASVRDQLVMLTKNIVFLCEKVLEKLPETFDANFRFDYTDQAPVDYRVEGCFNSTTFYTLPAGIQSASIGHLRPGHHATLLDCSSIFIADSYQAELSLKRFTTKLSDKLGFVANDVLYKTFVTDESSSHRTIGMMAEDGTNGGNKSNELSQDSPVMRPITRRDSERVNKGRDSPYVKKVHSRKR